jgi:hypothetical protein
MSGTKEFGEEDLIAMGEAVDQLITLDIGGRKVVKPDPFSPDSDYPMDSYVS